MNKVLSYEIKQVGEESDRTLRFVGSDETPDRDNDVIEVAGWVLDQYKKNPVFLWAHRHDELPIGKAVNIEKDLITRKLLLDIKFPTAEEYPFADTIYRLYKGGYLNATSVGFKGKKYKTRDEEAVLNLPEWQRGRRYMEQELLELSAVPVPANPNALVEVRSKGFSDEDIEKIFVDETEKSGAAISAKNKEILAAIHKDMDNCHDIMKGCRDRLKQFMDDNGDDPGEEPGEPPKSNNELTVKVEFTDEWKQAFEDLKTQMLLLCPKENADKVIDLDAIEFVKSPEPPDELPSADELAKMISDEIKNQLKGGT